GLYLDAVHRHRRDLWRLAHAHGTLFALIHIVFAIGLAQLGGWTDRTLRLASFLLIDGLLFVPLGFFLGGLDHTEVDPGPGILLVPIGAICMLIGVILVALAARKAERS